MTTSGPRSEVRKTVTAVFCDVVGSTSLGQRLDPEALRLVMRRYFEEMRGVLEAHGGLVAKFIGDAVVGVFGVPRLHEDDALRAVRAADEMRNRLAELNRSLRAQFDVELEAHLGVCTGEVVLGADDEVVLGDVMNTAARLEQIAAPDEILIADDTHRLVRHAVTTEPVAGMELKGMRSRVTAWRLLAIDPTAEPLTREFDRPLVGRERELRLLRRAFERAVAERRCVLATVLGFPGIGKSRLALELAASVAGEAQVLVGHCRSYGEGITYWPVAEMVREAAGVNTYSGLARLLQAEPDGERVAGLVAAALGEPMVSEGGEETLWAVRRLVEALAAAGPLVLVFEDIHWAEPTLLTVIEHLAERIRERAVLLLCLARPELLDDRPSWGRGKVDGASLLLKSLSDSAAQQMLQERLEGRPIAPGVRTRIMQSAQGVPLFLEQMLALLEEHDSIGVEDVPPAISGLLSARLESLEQVDRALLEEASVEGERFHAGALAALAADAPASVSARLDGLEAREMIRPDDADIAGERGFRFAHVLIRDAAYERVPKVERAVLHERLAAWLEDHGTGDELVGYHLERAFRLLAELAPPDERAEALARRASRLLAAAGRRGQGRVDYPAAVNLLSRAVNLLPVDDRERLELLPDLAFLLGEQDVSSSLPLLTEAIQRARATGNRRVEWRSAMIRSRVLLYNDPSSRPAAEVLAEAERATEQLEALGDKRGVASALVVRADVHEMAGELSRCYELYRRTAALSAGGVRARALGYAGWGLCLGTTPANEVEVGCLELLEAAGESHVDRALVLTSVGWAQAMQGRLGEGTQASTAGRDAVVEHGTADWLGVATLACGYVALLCDDLVAAEREFARAAETFAAQGDRWYLAVAAVDRALVLCALGRHTEALAVAASSRAPTDAEWATKWSRVQGLVDACEGWLDTALAHADASVSAAQATEYTNYHAAALADRAGIRDRLGHVREAVADLKDARVLYERKGNLVDADRIRRRLEASARRVSSRSL
ncbi:MAG TPA: AAA family ATPase [Thermoleophilaceae bacterium]